MDLKAGVDNEWGVVHFASITVCDDEFARVSVVLQKSTVRYSAVQPWLNDMQRAASATSGNGKVLCSH